jgi:cell wall-associated NlpC family hydrolase
VTELEVLSRAHQLFGRSVSPAPLIPADNLLPPALDTGRGNERYLLAPHRSRGALRSAARTDAAAAAVLDRAYQDHVHARGQTGNILDEARVDAAVVPDTPMAQREAMRRRVARLRAAHAQVLRARERAWRHLAALRILGYRVSRRRRSGPLRLPPPNGRVGIAVRAALSRLGRPYAWGATGPGQFDCSGLTQWSYEQAGIHLSRTTYQQIHDGIPVARWQVRPGDLVFPNAGHVQMAISHHLVVEAPHDGATVQISPLGADVQIRRPLP